MQRLMTAALLAASVSLFIVPRAALAQVSASDAWIRGTVAGQKATGAFMQIESRDGGRLVAAESPVAGVVEIHEMAMVNDVMRMRAIPALDLPAGRKVELKPGGHHVMLMDLKKPLKPGETVPIRLVIEGKGGRQTVEVQAQVREVAAPAKGSGHHGHGKH